MLKGKGKDEDVDYYKAIDDAFDKDLGEGFSDEWGDTSLITDIDTSPSQDSTGNGAINRTVAQGNTGMKEKNLYLLGRGVIKLIKECKDARKDKDVAVKQWRDLVYMSVPDRISPLGADGANVRTPVTWKHRQTLHAALLDFNTGIRPYFRAEPEDMEQSQQAVNIEDMLDALFTDPVDYFTLQDKMIGLALDEGTAFYYTCYRYEKRHVRANRIVTPEVAETLGYVLPADKSRWTYGTKLASQDKSKPDISIGQYLQSDGDEVIYNAPDVSAISYFDYFQSPTNATGPDDAFLCGHECFKNVGETKRLSLSGYFDKDAVKRLLSHTALRIITSDFQTNLSIDNQRLSGEGGTTVEDSEDDLITDTVFNKSKTNDSLTGSQSKSKAVRNSAILQFVYVTVPVDLDDQGQLRDVELVVETSTSIVVRAVIALSPSGCRPYIPLVLFNRSNRFYGMPIGQVLEPVQNEMDTVTNLSLDASALSMTAIVEERKSSENRTSRKQFGIGINSRLVDEEGSIKIHNFPMNTQDSFMDMKMIDRWGTDITAVSDNFAGSSEPGSNTATEVSQQQSSANRRVKVAARRLQVTSKILANACIDQIRQNIALFFSKKALMDNGQMTFGWLSAPEEYTFGQVTPIDLFTPISIFAHGDAENTDDVIKRQSAEKLWMALQSDKMFMGATAVRQWSVEKYVLESFGVRNVTDFIGTRSDAQGLDDKNKQSPPPVIPPIEATANAEFMALFLAMNPTLSQPVLQMLTAVSKAAEAGKPQNDPTGELMKQEIDSKSTMAQEKIKNEADKQKMGVDMHKQKAVMELESHHLDHTHQLKMAEQDASHNIAMNQQNASNTINTASQGASHNLQLQQAKVDAHTDSSVDKIHSEQKIATAINRSRTKSGSK